MEFIESNKGATKVVFNGYMYTKKATKPNRIRWECSSRVALSCKGALTTSLQVSVAYVSILL